ncbi:hypothetical protein EVAR_32927_1 [Eumeta japonica]|uniref:Tetratricopeptide repeat protein 29 n=1 Tax=Eumeta variegata TaxID=151549 RepID=A0A4C1X2P6_EUMVA|nr:hypothetical protein EVAR_32927_1 [Eumeta japonica]
MAENIEKSIEKRKIPKLMACMTKNSVENMRNRALFNLDTLDAKGLRRLRMPLHECLIIELRESAHIESSHFLQDLMYDNMQLLQNDDLAVVVDLRKRHDYLEHISEGLQKAECQKGKGHPDKETRQFLTMALFYSEKGKGILWLAERFFLVAMAISSQHLIDGGRLKACCKYHYSKFLVDKSFGNMMRALKPTHPVIRGSHVASAGSQCRQSAASPHIYARITTGHAALEGWLLYEGGDGDTISGTTVIKAAAKQLHRILLMKARQIRGEDPSKSESLCRLAEARAMDAQDSNRRAEAVVEIAISQFVMKDLNNALLTFERAYNIYHHSKNIEGLCNTNMHIASVMQRLDDHARAEKILLEMGTLAVERGLRRHLGRALYLLGELNLSREKPELGVQYFKEAFGCFMAYDWMNKNIFQTKDFGNEGDTRTDKEQTNEEQQIQGREDDSSGTESREGSAKGNFRESITPSDIHNAEKARLMMAVCAGQERMASYFDLLRTADDCNIARMKIIQWKLSNQTWWTDKEMYDFQSCPCPDHNRTPLDAVRNLKKYLKQKEEDVEEHKEEQLVLESHVTKKIII